MLIAFTGCDGAGKTTQVERLKQWLEERGYPVSIVDKWDLLDPRKFPECRFVRSSRDDVRLCIAEMNGFSRALFIFWMVGVTLTHEVLDSERHVYLLDGYWMKHAAAEIEYGVDKQWVESTTRMFPAADLTFYLDVAPDAALARKSDVHPYECGRRATDEPGAFVTHQAKLRARLLEWCGERGWVHIPAVEPDDVFQTVVDTTLAHIERSRFARTA